MDWMLATGLFLQLAIQMGTALLFGTLGGILNEKVGHINLGMEGMMLLGAAFGFMGAYYSNSIFIAVVAAGMAGAIGAFIYAIVTVSFRANQTVSGFALTILGTGMANFAGKNLAGLTLPESFMSRIGDMEIPVLSQIPIVGDAIFSQSLYALMGIVLALVLYIYMKKTSFGLKMRLVGENPSAADASGISVLAYKYAHISAGGFLVGLGGGYLSLVYVSRWQDDMTSGLGWIAVALVIFSTWNPLKAILGAYLFGALRVVSFKLQNVDLVVGNIDISIPSQWMDMLPYIMTIVVLIGITLQKRRENQAPAWLGKPYFREER